jgi:hypothetical protein
MSLVMGDRISRAQARRLIQIMAKHGNHYYEGQFSTDEEIKRFLAASGVDYEDMIEKCRIFTNSVLRFENLITSTAFSVGGGSLTLINNATRQTVAATEGPGMIAYSSYWALFEESFSQLRATLTGVSPMTSFLNCTTTGIAAVEAYIQHRAIIYNETNPQTPLIDSKNSKISFDDKINLWIPTMTVGAKLDKSDKLWTSFKVLQGYRDNSAIHVKSPVLSMSYTELANGLNHFRYGIAGLLVRLHILFAERIPARIIRCSFLPDIRYIESDHQATGA